MDHRDVVIRIGPVRVGRADIDIRFGGHPRMADAVCSPEPAEIVSAGHVGRIAQILDQFERVADRQDLRALDFLHLVGKVLHVAVIGDAVAARILRRSVLIEDGDAELVQQPVNGRLAFGDRPANSRPAAQIFLLGHLEPHDVFAWPGLAVDREAGRIRAAMLERLQHGGHFPADIAGAVAVDQSCNAAHSMSLPSSAAPRAGSSDRFPCPTRSWCAGNAPIHPACTLRKGGTCHRAWRPESPRPRQARPGRRRASWAAS